MSAAECMSINVDAYIANPVQLGICPPNPTDATYNCLCALPSFISWYLSTFCINCNGGQNPLANLTTICPNSNSTIENIYPNSCIDYGVKDAGVPPPNGSSSSNLSTTATLSNTSTGTSTSSTSSPSPTLSSSSSSTSISTTGSTTVIVTMTTPSFSPSSSKFLTVTASAASPWPSVHSFIITASNETASVIASPTFGSSTNETFTSTSKPTAQIPLSESSTNSSMSTGAKAGIGVGAAAAAIGIGFVFLSLLTILRRRNTRMKGPSYSRRDTKYIARGGAGDTSTTLAETYHDDEPAFYRGFNSSEGYGSGSGLGIAGIGTRPREKMGLVPSGRIREVMVGAGDENGGTEFAASLHAEDVREIRHGGDRISEYAEEEDFGATRESGGVWPPTPRDGCFQHPENQTQQRYSTHLQDATVRYSTVQDSDHIWHHDAENVGFQHRDDVAQRYSTHLQDAGIRYSTAHESNYETAMRPKSSIYSVVDSPVLDLGQAELSDEELARLEDEERRIDEAIRESESRANMKAEKGDIGTAL